MQEIDKRVLEEAVHGDEKAFEEIYKTFSGFVYSVSVRLVQNHADAQEVTQEVFLKIYKNLPTFEHRSSFKTWVYRITMNTALNWCKKRSHQKDRTDGYDAALRTQEVPAQVERRAQQSHQELKLQKLLRVLNPDQRACIVLREIEGMDYQQIAETLDTNVNTVRTRLKRAREKLISYAKRGELDEV